VRSAEPHFAIDCAIAAEGLARSRIPQTSATSTICLRVTQQKSSATPRLPHGCKCCAVRNKATSPKLTQQEQGCSGCRADPQHAFGAVTRSLDFLTPLWCELVCFLRGYAQPLTTPTAADTSRRYEHTQEWQTAGIWHFLQEKSISPLIFNFHSI